MPTPKTWPGSWPLTYVCKYCGEKIATYPEVRATEPATLGVCDKPECRRQAGEAYRADA